MIRANIWSFKLQTSGPQSSLNMNRWSWQWYSTCQGRGWRGNERSWPPLGQSERRSLLDPESLESWHGRQLPMLLSLPPTQYIRVFYRSLCRELCSDWPYRLLWYVTVTEFCCTWFRRNRHDNCDEKSISESDSFSQFGVVAMSLCNFSCDQLENYNMNSRFSHFRKTTRAHWASLLVAP